MAGCSSSTPGQGATFCPDVPTLPASATPSASPFISSSPDHVLIIEQFYSDNGERVRLKADTTGSAEQAAGAPFRSRVVQAFRPARADQFAPGSDGRHTHVCTPEQQDRRGRDRIAQCSCATLCVLPVRSVSG